MLLEKIADQYLWVICAILLVNLSQRKIADSEKKRFATIYIAALALLLDVFMIIIITRAWPQWTIVFGVIIVVAIGYIFRNKVWPFRFHCVECHVKLDGKHIIGHDDNLCESCWAKEHPEEAAKIAAEEEEKQRGVEAEIAQDDSLANDVSEIDWDLWDPKETCVITYLFDGKDNVLLIDKKRGLGDGLVNAPGGHLELAETAEEAAIREFDEETGLKVSNLTHMGILHFQFKDGLSMKGHVFFATSFEGEMKETDEARPFWCPVSEIPYEKMWEDDALWLPKALTGQHFNGYFIFDDRKMISEKIEIIEASKDEE